MFVDKKHTKAIYGIDKNAGAEMNKTQLIEILNDWNFWKKKPDIGIIREEYLGKIHKLSRTGQIVAIIGARRSGKSTLMFQYLDSLIKQGCEM